MKDNAFQQRRDIERMLLSGKKLTTSEMMKMYGVGSTRTRSRRNSWNAWKKLL